jgi:hypothetical protein
LLIAVEPSSVGVPSDAIAYREMLPEPVLTVNRNSPSWYRGVVTDVVVPLAQTTITVGGMLAAAKIAKGKDDGK